MIAKLAINHLIFDYLFECMAITKNVFKQSKMQVIFSFFAFIFFLSIFVLGLIMSDESKEMIARLLMHSISFLLLISMSWLFLSSLNYRLIVNDDFLVYINFLGVKRQYRYEEITQVIGYYDKSGKRLEKYIISVGNKKIEINYFYGDLSALLSLIKKRLKKHENHLKIKYEKSKI